jgi:hypothetical protein
MTDEIRRLTMETLIPYFKKEISNNRSHFQTKPLKERVSYERILCSNSVRCQKSLVVQDTMSLMIILKW